MSKIEKFEDLKCWQAARMLVKNVYKLSSKGALGKDFDTKSQLRRAALSAMNNIAEGFGRFGKKDFIKFLNVSQSSVQEVQSMLYVLEDLEYLLKEDLALLRSKSAETRNLTLGLIKYLSNKNT
jgi:four helix bundle protein